MGCAKRRIRLPLWSQGIAALSDAGLCAKTEEFKSRLAKGESLEALLPEAFAVVREAGERTLQMRDFDVQLIGGIVLHEGKIAEMRTGEGKTLVATLPVYLNALTGKGVHVVTVNDYLAQRDADWMGQVPGFGNERRRGHCRDESPMKNAPPTMPTSPTALITNMGFDYLRDNMAFTLDQKVQRAALRAGG